MLAVVERSCDRFEKIVPHAQGLVFVVDLIDDDDELVAAGSADDAVWADGVAQSQGEFAQEAVPRGMRHRIVDGFEAIHVDEEDADLMRRSRRAFDRRDESRAGKRAIRQLRQCVVLGEVPQPLLGDLTIRDIEHDADHAPRPRRAFFEMKAPRLEDVTDSSVARDDAVFESVGLALRTRAREFRAHRRRIVRMIEFAQKRRAFAPGIDTEEAIELR